MSQQWEEMRRRSENIRDAYNRADEHAYITEARARWARMQELEKNEALHVIQETVKRGIEVSAT